MEVSEDGFVQFFFRHRVISRHHSLQMTPCTFHRIQIRGTRRPRTNQLDLVSPKEVADQCTTVTPCIVLLEETAAMTHGPQERLLGETLLNVGSTGQPLGAWQNDNLAEPLTKRHPHH
jgi:hypothetical protein